MSQIYQEIGRRTGGNIYIGVVGPVRTGKSTLVESGGSVPVRVYTGIQRGPD